MAKIEKPLLHYSFLVGCLVFIWVYGVANLKALPIANDEFNTLARIRDISRGAPHSLPQTLEYLAEISPDHGPLYFILLNLWQRIAGADLFALRLPSVFFGMLAAAVAYRLARLGGSAESGLAAVPLLAFLSFFLYYTHIARMYTALALVGGALVWSYWRASHAGGQTKGFARLALFFSAAAIAYIHYSGVLLLGALGIYHLVFAKKDRRWWRVAALGSAAVLLFLPWLPVVLDGLARSSVVTEARLSLPGALGAGFSIYANGIVILPVALGALIWRYRRRFNRAERYIVLATIFAALLVLLLNEFTPLIVERRLRYLTFLALPVCGVFALALRCLPGGDRLRVLLFPLWLLGAFAYARSPIFDVYTNRQALHEDHLAHYQAFRYELRKVPGYNQLILSFHPDAPVVWKTVEYYRAILAGWDTIAHLSYDEDGRLRLQSGIPPKLTLDDIAAKYAGVWVIYDPAQTDLKALAVYRDWFLARFKPCKRFLEMQNNIIDFYLQRELPCGLVYAPQPRAIQYEGGAALGNVIVEQAPDALTAYFWWLDIGAGDYAFSLQIFDRRGEKLANEDGLLYRQPLEVRQIDIASLPAGDYRLALIVYDRETGKSQSGRVAGERFERLVEIARFTIYE